MSELYLRVLENQTHCHRVLLKWESQDGEARITQPQVTKGMLTDGFTAGGKHYQNLRQLCGKTPNAEGLYRDIYGRQILCVKERFPCFDSYDYLHENRYFRWFYLLEDGKLTVVYTADERDLVEVTEDVAWVRTEHWEAMCKVWNCE